MSIMRCFAVSLGLCLAMCLAVGCGSQPYDPGYTFYPQPATVEVRHRAGAQQEQTPLIALVTVLGVHRADEDHHIPYSIDVRMRLENNGPSTVRFDPRTLELVTGTLQAFGYPLLQPPRVLELAPSQRAELTAYFPFPPNTSASSMNLNNLRLRWTVEVAGHPVPQTAYFQRVGPVMDQYNYDSDMYY